LDNSFLIALLETGWVGFSFLVVFLLYLVWRSLKQILANKDDLSALAFAILLAFISRMATGGANADWSVGPVMFLTVALVYRMANREQS